MLQGNGTGSQLGNHLVHRKESIYFGLTLLVSILMYISLIVSVVGILVIAFLACYTYFIHGISMASIRRNGVKISKNQFPVIYEKAEMLAEKMELKKMPNIYVLESSGLLNAFATRFFGKNIVVIFSEIFDLSEDGREDELMFILAHEYAHLKRRHITVNMLLLPAMFIPFLGNAYSRACEYTCDRYATYYVGNIEAAKEALVMLAIGKQLSAKVNQEAYIEQVSEESGFFAWLSERLSSHPDLPKRLNAIDHWLQPEQYPLVREKKSGIVIGMIFSIFLLVSVIGVIVAVEASLKDLPTFGDESSSYIDEPAFEPELTPLSQAASENDLEQLEQLITDGADLEEKNSEGSTALQYAVIWGNIEAAELLLENGADVNTTDSLESTPLINAAYNETSAEMLQMLLDYGADPSLEDSDGYTAYDYAVEYNQTKLIDLLKEPSSEL